MSLKTALMQSKKLTGKFQRAVACIDDATKPDTPLFRGVMELSSASRRELRKLEKTPGFDIGMVIGSGAIVTLHNISLNGLKALAENANVLRVDAPSRITPALRTTPRRTFFGN